MSDKKAKEVVEVAKRISQLSPSMQDVLIAGFDLGRASAEQEKEVSVEK